MSSGSGLSDLLVLCYHALSDNWQAKTTVIPRDFEDHMVELVRRGYVGATFGDALTAPPAPRTLAVSFDDAHASVLEHAVPVLNRLGLPATVFVATDYPDSGRPMTWDGYDAWLGSEHERELRCMGWDDLRRLAASGWEIGSHTCSHPRLSLLEPDQARRELVESKAACEEAIDAPCISLAYPYSYHDDFVMRAARDCGYLFAATVAQEPTAPLPFKWPRVPMRHGEGVAQMLERTGRRRMAPLPAAPSQTVR
jgi:peptidoglycan/xylan/chitin deacetylase (PgdA/CDA1 family)